MNLVLAALSTLAAASLATLQAKIPGTDAPPSVPPVARVIEPDVRKPVAPATLPDTGNPALAAEPGATGKPRGKPAMLPETKPDTYL